MTSEVWWLHYADYDQNAGTPSDGAFSERHAEQYPTLGKAIDATASTPEGKHPWILGDDVLFAPNQIKPLRKLRYKPQD